MYLYGLLDAEQDVGRQDLAEVTGLQGPPELRTIGDWLLICGDHNGSEILPRRRSMLAHTRVVEAAMALGTVLPARFGLVAAGFDDIATRVMRRHAEIDDLFARLGGCIELGVRITYPKEAALAATLAEDKALIAARDALLKRGPEAHFDRAAFGQKLAEALDRRRGDLQKKLIEGLRPHCTDHVLRAPEDDAEALRAEFLVNRTAQKAFIEEVESIAANRAFAGEAEAVIKIIGPAPMYNFTNLSLTLDDTEAAA